MLMVLRLCLFAEVFAYKEGWMVNNWGRIGKGMIAELTRNRRTAKKTIKD